MIYVPIELTGVKFLHFRAFINSFPHSLLITGFVTILKRRVSLVEQELLTFPEHLSSPPVFSGVRVTRSLVLYVCFVDRCLSCCPFSFDHCVVCSSSIYGFWLPLWYLQTPLKKAPTAVFMGKVPFVDVSCTSWNINGNFLTVCFDWTLYVSYIPIAFQPEFVQYDFPIQY